MTKLLKVLNESIRGVQNENYKFYYLHNFNFDFEPGDFNSKGFCKGTTQLLNMAITDYILSEYTISEAVVREYNNGKASNIADCHAVWHEVERDILRSPAMITAITALVTDYKKELNLGRKSIKTGVNYIIHEVILFAGDIVDGVVDEPPPFPRSRKKRK